MGFDYFFSKLDQANRLKFLFPQLWLAIQLIMITSRNTCEVLEYNLRVIPTWLRRKKVVLIIIISFTFFSRLGMFFSALLFWAC